MKRIIKVLFAAFVLTLVPATYANAQWKDRGDFFEGLAAVVDANGKYGFINKTGKVVIPCKWTFTYSFHEGLAVVMDANDKYGFINKTGKVVIPCQWRDADDFHEGLASVYDDNGNEYKIGKTGEIVGRSVDPNSMSWPSPSYDSGWELKNERLFSNKKCWNRGLKWNGGKVVQIIKEIDEHSGRVKHYWVVESGKVYKNENDAEGAAYFYSVYGLKRTRGEGSNFN